MSEDGRRVLLELNGVTKRFGGLQAVRDVSFEVGEGEIVGLIGPNGAGKSTVFKTIMGTWVPDGGTITFEGRPIGGMAPHRIARLGIAMAHQIPKPLPELTVAQNAMVGAAFGRENASLDRALDLAEQALEFVGLHDKRDHLARHLNASEKSRLELARAVAANPIVFLLDEIAAGLNPTEVAELLEKLRGIRARGHTIVMVEHVMQAVMGLSDRIVVLEQGAKIAEGRPEEVARNERVIEAYLGEPEADEQLDGEPEPQPEGETDGAA
jgi:branched-chain amino acid transport system ATP-binding protein